MGPIEDAKQLAEDIRYYSKSQKKLWQQVPWLALEADGRTSYSDLYKVAYREGLWGIISSYPNGPPFNVYVDLASGELVNPYLEGKLAREEEIVRLAFHMYELNASDVIRFLKEEGKRPHFPSYRTTQVREWRSNLREKFSIEEIFTRK